MHRLPLILSLIALLGALASAAFFLRIGDTKKTLEIRLADAHSRAAKLDADLAAANERNGALKARQAELTAELETARVQFRVADTRATQLERDLRQTRDVLELYDTTARSLADEVAGLRRELSDTRSSHASPETVAAYKNTIAELERQLALSRDGAALPSAAGASTAVFASRAGRATVLTVGPQNAFVVLNFGSARGAQTGQKLTLSRGPTTLATVLVSDVRANFSVAQVLPETLRGVLQKGDSAVLIR